MITLIAHIFTLCQIDYNLNNVHKIIPYRSWFEFTKAVISYGTNVFSPERKKKHM